MLENSLFGLPQGSAYITKAQNTYQAAPSILKDSIDYLKSEGYVFQNFYDLIG